MYVIDELGNWDFCTTYIDVQDNMGTCEDNELMALVSGTIQDWNNRPVEEVKVEVLNTNTNRTQADGYYNFDLVMYENYTIQPEKLDQM